MLSTIEKKRYVVRYVTKNAGIRIVLCAYVRGHSRADARATFLSMWSNAIVVAVNLDKGSF